MNLLLTMNFSSLFDTIEKNILPMVFFYGDRAKLCGVTGVVRLGGQGNDGSCPADSNPDFLEDFVEGVDNGWAAFVRNVGKTVQTSSGFVSLGSDTFNNLVLRWARFREDVRWKFRSDHGEYVVDLDISRYVLEK
jgi:hypothetical protein